jgi:sugar phosphate isomerase/epimerase
VPTNPIAVFTKPWKCSLPELGEKLARWGVDGLELPVRPGYPVTPENVRDELPRAVATLASFGQTIYSVAGTIDEPTIQACGDSGIPIIRVCERIDMKLGYRESVLRIRQLYQRMLPLLARSNVKIGLQNHCDHFVGSAAGTMEVIGDFDPGQVGAVLDVAHCGLDGEPEDMAIDIVWSHLCMVNLKNAFRMRLNGPEAEAAEWRTYWTTGRHGYASWRKTLAELRRRGYAGPLCLCAEYSNPKGGDLVGDDVNRLLEEDIAYLKALLAGS